MQQQIPIQVAKEVNKINLEELGWRHETFDGEFLGVEWYTVGTDWTLDRASDDSNCWQLYKGVRQEPVCKVPLRTINDVEKMMSLYGIETSRFAIVRAA